MPFVHSRGLNNFTVSMLKDHLTLCAPKKVEDTGFHKFLWVLIYCHMKLSAIHQLNFGSLKNRIGSSILLSLSSPTVIH